MTTQRQGMFHDAGAGLSRPTPAVPVPILSGSFIVGGLLIVVGATLPWLTMYAGLQQYRGIIGSYGWATLALGVLAVALGLAMLRYRLPWLIWLAAAVGTVTLGFAAWLMEGLHEIVNRPESLMLVSRPGVGLFMVLAGASLIVAAAAPECILQARSAGFRIVANQRDSQSHLT